QCVHWGPSATIGTETRIRITVEAGGAYQPYHHWAYQGIFTPELSDADPRARFGWNSEVILLDAEIARRADDIEVRLTWLGPAPDACDALLFVLLYTIRDAPPVAQAAAHRPCGGALPPGAWPPGASHAA